VEKECGKAEARASILARCEQPVNNREQAPKRLIISAKEEGLCHPFFFYRVDQEEATARSPLKWHVIEVISAFFPSRWDRWKLAGGVSPDLYTHISLFVPTGRIIKARHAVPGRDSLKSVRPEGTSHAGEVAHGLSRRRQLPTPPIA
jgi:hypothetical protein